jgi:vacuolar iron transporter family protein
VSDRLPEWSRFGALGVNVDPLVITGGVGEEIDLLLCDSEILGVPQVLSNECLEVLDAVNLRCHRCLLALPEQLYGCQYAATMSALLAPGHHRQVTGGWARAAIFGASDGIVTNVSLILGFAGANPGHTVVRLAGLAGLVAGACSMAAGEYLSVQAQRELIEREIDVERKSLADHPAAEHAELLQIFVDRGIEPKMADTMVTAIMADPELALRTHTREELGVDPGSVGSPWGAAAGSLIAFSIGAFLPLFPWLVTSSGNQVWWSVGVGAVGAFIVGSLVGTFTERGIWRSGIRQLIITAGAAAITWGVGHQVGAH